jgi:hypothetical protein
VGDKFTLICQGYTGTSSPADAVVTVVSVFPDGSINDFTIADGTGTYTKGFAQGGVRTYGPIGTVTVAAGGTNYAVGDLLTITQSGGANGVYEVLTLGASDAVATVGLVTRGSGYHVEAGLATTTDSAAGADCTLSIATIADVDASGKTYNKPVWEITNVGLPAAATINAIDTNVDDATAFQTYSIKIARAGDGNNLTPPDAAFTEMKINTYGSIRAGHISTETGTFAAGDVLKVMQTTDKGGRITVLSVDESDDIATFAITSRGVGYTVADDLELHDASGDTGGRFDLTAIGDYTLSGGTVTFLADPTYAADLTGPVYVDEIGPYAYELNGTISRERRKPTQGDWLWATFTNAVTNVFTFTSSHVGATPTVSAYSTSTGSKTIERQARAGGVKTIAVKDGGSDYEVGDIITLDATPVGESGSGCYIEVLTLAGSAIATFAVMNPGQDYTVEDDVTSTGHTGDATFTISAITTEDEWITVPASSYTLSGTGSLICTINDTQALVDDGDGVRMCHTFALGNKLAIENTIDAACATEETYVVEEDGVAQVLDTDYVLLGGLRLGSYLTCSVATATAAAGDVLALVQSGATGGQITVLTVDGSDDIATFEVTAAGSGYTIESDLSVTKVSGSGTEHDSITFDIEAGDLDYSHVKWLTDKSPAADTEVHILVKSNQMVLAQGDALRFDRGENGGWQYRGLIPTAAEVLAVSYV